MQYLNLHCGNKGFILSLDAVLAVILFSIILSSFLFYPSKEREVLQKLHISREGSDAIALVDYNKKIDTLDEQQIKQELASLLNSSEMSLNITYSDTRLQSKSRLVFGNQPKGFVSSGKRFFVVGNGTDINYFAVARYKIWKK